MNAMRRVMAAAAATAMLATGGVVAATSASAATSCQRVEGARLCVTVVWPVGSNSYSARGTITDLAGGPNLSVAVTNVKLQRYDGTGGWKTVRETYDYDGWDGKADSGSTTSVNPCKHPHSSYRTVATFHWRGGQSGTKTIAGIPHGHTC